MINPAKKHFSFVILTQGYVFIDFLNNIFENEEGEGRERERETSIDCLSCALTGNQIPLLVYRQHSD